ncbi:unnamed protein product, partial [marine sediment metagenome]
MPEAYALTPTPVAARQAMAAGTLSVSQEAAVRRAVLTRRAEARRAAAPVAAPAVAPPEMEGLETRLGSLIPDVQELLGRDWSEWWDIMSGGLAQQVPEGVDVREAVVPGLAAVVPAVDAAVGPWFR